MVAYPIRKVGVLEPSCQYSSCSSCSIVPKSSQPPQNLCRPLNKDDNKDNNFVVMFVEKYIVKYVENENKDEKGGTESQGRI